MQRGYFNKKILSILILAAGVRLLGISSRPIWYDEAFSILFAEKGWSAMVYGTLAPTGIGSADIHPLGYYTLLWLWMKLFGESLIAVRSLSIIAGLVSVYLIYLIAREITSDVSTAYLSMLFAALAPFQIHYSQEIRMYAILGMWLLLATYAFQRGTRDGHWKWWALFSISAALAQYSHNLAAFYLVSLALLPIFQKNWVAFRAVVLAGAGALILYSPWLIHLPSQFTKVQNSYWVARPDSSQLFTLPMVYLTNTPLPPQLIAGALAMVLVIVIISMIQTVKHIHLSGIGTGAWLLYLSFGPPLLLFLFSQWRPIYIERALLPSGAIFCIWMAWVIRNTKMQRAVQYSLLGLLGFSSLLGIYQHLSYRDFPYGPFAALDRSLREKIDATAVVVHSNKLSMLPAMLFDRKLPQSFIGDPPGSSTDTLAQATQNVLGITAEPSIKSATKNANQVWYIIYFRSIKEYEAAGHGTHPDIKYLDSRFRLKSVENWDGLQVFLYTREP